MPVRGMKLFLVSKVSLGWSFSASSSRMTSFLKESWRAEEVLTLLQAANSMFAMLTRLSLFQGAVCMFYPQGQNNDFISSYNKLLQSLMYSKYLDYYEPATNAHKQAQLECEQKDVVIGQLRGELQELRHLDGDYYRLNELIHGLEGKYSLLIAERDRSEKEQKVKSDIDKKSIIDLRGEIDDLRVQLQKTNLIIEELIRNNANVKRQVQSRATQVQNFRYQIRELENKNQRSNDENRSLALNLKALKEERKRIEDACEELSALLDEHMAKLKNTEKDVRASESNNARLEKMLYQAEKDNTKLVAELKEKNEETKKADNKLKGVSNGIADLAISYRNLEQQTNKSKAELDKNNGILVREMDKGRDILGKIASVEANIRTQEQELDLVIAEEEDLRKQHFSSLEQNKNLNMEIDKVLALIAEYEQVNRELLDQIEYFIEQDQQARSMLDRAEVMRQIVDGSIRKIALTEDAIKHLKC